MGTESVLLPQKYSGTGTEKYGVLIKSEILGTGYGRVRINFENPVRVRVRVLIFFLNMVRGQYGY